MATPKGPAARSVRSAVPRRPRLDGAGLSRGCGSRPLPGGLRSLWLRMRVAFGSVDLDRALARGADPTASAEIAFRAARLVRERNRRGLARCVRVVIWEAEAGVSALRVSPRPVRREEVLCCREVLLALSERLELPGPVSPEGVAIAERLLADLKSPLFEWAEPGTVRRLARLAATAMDPTLIEPGGGAY
jgi:hypothetical protein